MSNNWKSVSSLISSGKKWEISNDKKKKEITLSFIHDKGRMMRNSIVVTYLEFEDLIDFITNIDKSK
jgi:hypothetical protein